VALTPYYSDELSGITIYHGDMFDVLPELSGIGGVLTDPPYSSGGAFRGDRMQKASAKYVNSQTAAYRPEFAGDNRDQRSYLAWCSLWMNAARMACTTGAPIACFTDWRQLPTTTDAIQAGGWTWRGLAVWSKGYGRPNPAGFSNAAEYAVWGTNGPATEQEDYPPGVFECQPPTQRDHIAQKPEAVMRWLVRIARPGATICDPFMGSGTTLRAAMDLGYKSIGVECDERYCEIAAKRLGQGTFDLGAV
jgi:site-specific DNA-methyltransferase (adenine-specific)